MTDTQIDNLRGRANLLSLSLFDVGRTGDATIVDTLSEELALARAEIARLKSDDHSPLLSK